MARRLVGEFSPPRELVAIAAPRIAYAQEDVPALIKLLDEQPAGMDRAAWKEKRREVARKLVRAAQSGVKSAAGSAPKRARATQTAELQKIIADVQRGGVKSGTRLYAKVQAIAQARTPPIACSASTIKAAMRRSK